MCTPRLWTLPQENTYPSPNFPNTHERLGSYRSLTSALTGTRALQSIENKIDRIEALIYQKDPKAAVATVLTDKGQRLSQDALEGMMQTHFDSFLGQVAESVGQMVRQEVGQHLEKVRTAVGKDFGAAQEVMMREVLEAREQDRADTRCEFKAQLQVLLKSIKVEGSIRHQGTEEHLAKLLSDQAAALRGIEQKQDMQEQRDRKQAQDVVDSVQELREAVEKLMQALRMLETNDMACQREMRRMISELQQELVAADLARRLEKKEESKRHIEADENFSAIETRVAELAEDFSELTETLNNRRDGLVKEIEGLKRQQDQILTSLQENHRQQQQYLESRLLSPAASDVASGTTLVNAPQTASISRQRGKRPTRRPGATGANGPSTAPPNNVRGNPETPTHPSLNNTNSGQNFKRKRIKIEPGRAIRLTERTMMTRMMSKVLGGIIT
ncbi:hypothetical protein BG006_006445 [Podila minutissima]|uniref:Uncharacterized protein n=1 Tax=Podila minutissima TaxID=64525 RepID=A0A9P5VL21_9FUNG|nr:hypothetical protein BG006_006445 [Podila minutissima]